MNNIFKEISRWWMNFTYDVWRFFFYKSPIFIELGFHKCWKEWRQAKKYFLKPVVEFRHTRYSVDGDDRYTWSAYEPHRWFGLYVMPLDWKMKYYDPRHEHNPGIGLTIGDHQFVWELRSPSQTDRFDDMNYWEAILNYLYGQWDRDNKCYIKSIKFAYDAHGWYDTQYSEEDKAAHKYDKPISETYYYIDEVLTDYAKCELRTEGVVLHPGGVEIKYFTYEN